MTLQASGPISLNDVNIELGITGTTQASLGQASYRTLAGVPSGQISMSNFYGKSNTFSFTISSNQTNLNLASYATSVGWNGSSAVQATIGSGVWIYSTSTGTPALTTGSFPGGLTIVNNGYIAGKGGNGGGAGAGSNGGPAISLGTSLTIDNTNGSAYIGGGGGGGAGKNNAGDYAGGGGGAGGGNGGNAPNSSGGVGSTTPGAAGGEGVGCSGGFNGYGGGAGGGGGVDVCPGGGGGLIFPGVGGAGGNNGSGGVGGSGGSANGGGGNGSQGGGGGGGWGASGGYDPSYPATPGSGGRAVQLNGYSVTWTSGNTSRVYGAVS